MAKYTLGLNCVLDNETGAVIPKDKNNRHCQAFLQWVIDGNIPDPMTEAQKAIYE